MGGMKADQTPVTKAEFVAGRLARFGATDTDKNGVVTAAERQARIFFVFRCCTRGSNPVSLEMMWKNPRGSTVANWPIWKAIWKSKALEPLPDIRT